MLYRGVLTFNLFCLINIATLEASEIPNVRYFERISEDEHEYGLVFYGMNGYSQAMSISRSSDSQYHFTTVETGFDQDAALAAETIFQIMKARFRIQQLTPSRRQRSLR